jgi:formylglycine-generating enzyme
MSGAGGGGGRGGSAGMPGCPQTGRGPAMIEVPRASGGVYCVDRSEVTNAQYDAFLATAPAASPTAPCAFNTSYARQTGPSCDPLPTTGANAPVACVDWCDAKAFCEWSGKRLCGAVDGGPVALASFDNPATDAWFRACSHAGERRLPYGNTYDGSYCAGLDYGVTRPVNVATLANCQGGYDALWDMSGNVSEWEDACSATSGASDTCAHRGGSWYDLKAGAPLYCNSSLPNDTTPMPETVRRDTRDIHIGFRCCANP